MSGTRYLTHPEAAVHLADAAVEFALLANPAYVFPPQELVPLGHKYDALHEGCSAVVLDMDGTTTLTEDLCLHALEYLVRQMTGRPEKRQWPGLDAAVDYPHIIGHSATSNIEYLLRAYAAGVRMEAFEAAYVKAAAWNVVHAPHAARKQEARENLAALGISAAMEDPAFAALAALPPGCVGAMTEAVCGVARRYGPALRHALRFHVNQTRAALDIYYESLHGMFSRIDAGRGREVAEEVYGPGRTHPIAPLAGLGELMSLAKGLLGEEAAGLVPLLARDCPGGVASGGRLGALGGYFARFPAQVALCTSSTAYEVRVVLGEVFRGLRESIAQWPISESRRNRVMEAFASPEGFYDAIITASETHEIRLKPHRDLYSIAMHRLGITPNDFHRVIGFEDTEAGVLAMRGAGIGVPVAVPFHGTQGHDFRAASHVVAHGLPEVLLRHGLFVPENRLGM
jgi:beta-phosphoglucomutase-like phosphatase (HAD superfamily)